MRKSELHQMVRDYADAIVETESLVRDFDPDRYYAAVTARAEARAVLFQAITDLELLP